MADPRALHDLSDDDGDMESTTLGVDLFGSQDVPRYPPIARLGRYNILGRLARGGMAEVYLARSEDEDGTTRHVVVKRVLSEMAHDPVMLGLFVEEGKTALRLFHPNVCHVYEVAETNGLTYMVLEWVQGTSLRELIQRAWRNGNLPIQLGVHIIARVASALEYVHTARGIDGKPLSIIHQDVTPHNVMISWRGQVKLLDFGIAKTTSGKTTGTGQGKHAYMSPEQVKQQPIDARADVFALGVCLYEVLTGKKLYHRDAIHITMQAVVDDPVPSARSVRPEIPEALDRIVQRALAKRPQDRFQSAGEMQHALDEWSARNGGSIPDVRVSLTTSSYFSPAEKAPLPTQAKEQLTGTFAALTGAPPTTGAAIPLPTVATPQPLWTPKQRKPTVMERLQSMTPAMAFGLTVSLGVFVLGIFALLILLFR